MNRRSELARQQAATGAILRRRLILIGVSTVVLLGAVAFLQQKKNSGGSPLVEDRTVQETSLALPELDQVLLDQVRDGSLAEQVMLEPEPFAHVAKIAQALLPALLQRLGEPAFPFAPNPAASAPLRGKPYRMRGRLLEGAMIARTESSPAEYWTIVRTDAGEEFRHVSVMQPEYPFVQGDYVLADGYYYKQYSQLQDGQRKTLPLFVGRQLQFSVPVLEPATAPDPLFLSRVEDPHITEDLPVDLEAMWHLANVAQTLRNRPTELEAVFAQAPWLDVKTLAALNETPEAFRGAPLRIGGILSRGDTWPAGENPLRETAYSEAWIANSTFGDIRVMLRTPGRFDFNRVQGTWEFRGWFQQMWSYESTKGDRFRVPVFVFADAHPLVGRAPAMVGQMTGVLLTVATLMGALLFFLVRLDRARTERSDRLIHERRKSRRANSSNGE